MLRDHLNPRVWLRDWLNKPTATEVVKSRAEAMPRHTVEIDPDTGFIVGTRVDRLFSTQSDPGDRPGGPESPTPAT